MVVTNLRYVTRDSLQQPHPVWHRAPDCGSGDHLAVLDVLAGKFARPCPRCAGGEVPFEVNLTDESNLRLLAPDKF